MTDVYVKVTKPSRGHENDSKRGKREPRLPKEKVLLVGWVNKMTAFGMGVHGSTLISYQQSTLVTCNHNYTAGSDFFLSHLPG